MKTIDAGCDVFDWEIAAVRADEAVELLRGPSTTTRTVITVNACTMRLAERDDELDAAVRRADMRVADGMGVVWGWRLLGRRLPERVPGIDLMNDLITAAATDGRSIYLLGATDEVLTALIEVLHRRHRGLEIAGHHHGYFDEVTSHAIIDDVKSSGADILFIGMPSPFKEVWAERHRDDFGVDLILGVGGSFDVVAGFTPRAPRLLQRVGMEWAWRLACEPRRMWKRYLLTNGWLARRLVPRMLNAARRS